MKYFTLLLAFAILGCSKSASPGALGVGENRGEAISSGPGSGVGSSSKLVAIDSLQVQTGINILSDITTKSGGDSYGGGDQVDFTKLTAWFYGNEQIDVCYQLTPFFGIDSSKVEDSFNQVVLVWRDYFSKKQIGSSLEDEYKINLNFVLKSKCEGGEDLVLYLGTGPIFGNLRDLRAQQHYYRPSAYTNKTHISENLKWSKGYILFVEPESYEFSEGVYFPVWDRGEAFYNMLLHEIGHTLGFDHVEGTIMKRLISDHNFTVGTDYQQKMSIDLSKELYPCASCTQSYSLASGNLNQISSIEISLDKKVFFRGSDKHAEVLEVVSKNSETVLFSFFRMSSYVQQIPYLYFIKYGDEYYSLELIERRAVLRKNGQQVAEFIRVGE